MILDSTKLKKIRESKHLSQAQTAELIGLSQATYWEWEKSDSNVKLENVLKLCNAFNVEIEELAKDNTTINIINNQNHNKDNSQAVVGFDIKLTQSDLINELKQLRTEMKDLMQALNKRDTETDHQ